MTWPGPRGCAAAGEVMACALLALATTATAFGLTAAPGVGRRSSVGPSFPARCGALGRRAPIGAPRHARDARAGVRQCVAVDTIEMYRGPFAKPEFLPLGMAQGFPKWILSDDGAGEPELRPMFNSASYGEEDGWVDPFSFEELWLPSDLPAPVMRPCISAVAKDGQIRYLLPALEFSVQAGGKLWWNRGMNSIPVAGRWMDVNAVNLASLSMVGFSQGGAHMCMHMCVCGERERAKEIRKDECYC